MNHSLEPWRLEYGDYRRQAIGGRPPDGEICVVVAANDETVSFGEYEDWYAGEPDLERAVACVNFLKGVPTESLVKMMGEYSMYENFMDLTRYGIREAMHQIHQRDRNLRKGKP